jgi:hypothetical protein
MVFIESVMDRFDAPAPVIHSSDNGAEIDYGPAARSTATTPSSSQPGKTAGPAVPTGLGVALAEAGAAAITGSLIWDGGQTFDQMAGKLKA